MTAPLLFLAADPREFSGWVSRWQDVQPVSLAVLWARRGMWKGRPVAAIANGVGAGRAFAAVIVAGEVTGVCNIGYCGALDPELAAGDIVIAAEVRNGTRSWQAGLPGGSFLDGVPASARFGIVASIDHIARTAAEKRELRATGASVVEMEAAGAARACEDLSLPFYCIRAVSDLAGEDLANDFNAALTSDGTFSAFRLAAGALASPVKRLSELMRLRQRTTIASKNLGDFLAGCSF